MPKVPQEGTPHAELLELRSRLFDGWAVLMRAMDACEMRLAATGVRASDGGLKP